MIRRDFILSIGACPIAFNSIIRDVSDLMMPGFRHELLKGFVAANDQSIPGLLDRQQLDPRHVNFGGLTDQYGIYTPGAVTGWIKRVVSAYTSEMSDYYRSNDLLNPLEIAVQNLLQFQHSDGTIDLLSTNFHSTPDTAFIVEHICLAYKLLKPWEGEIGRINTVLKQFLLQAGDALTTGGIHTPNHRWVVCMALSRINELFPNPKYIDRIETWLNEEIDIDPDGQYTERSTHVYSPLTDRTLITVARLAGREDLYDHVRKNLDMTLYYVHPDGTLVTETSGRQDQYTTGTLQNYLYPYLYMAQLDRNGKFATMANRIVNWIGIKGLSSNLALFQEDQGLGTELPPEAAIPEFYEEYFPHSQMVRIRKGPFDATILGNNPVFFTFQKGKAVLQAVRLASAFFGKGQFVSERIEWHGDKVILNMSLEAPYFQPYPNDQIPGDGVWENMPRQNRPTSEVQTIHYHVEIAQNDLGFDLRFDIKGTDSVPVALELAFKKGGVLEGVRSVNGMDGVFLLNEDTASYTVGKSKINFGPGQVGHTWTQLRGALPKLDSDSVYITGFTPFQFALQVS